MSVHIHKFIYTYTHTMHEENHKSRLYLGEISLFSSSCLFVFPKLSTRAPWGIGNRFSNMLKVKKNQVDLSNGLQSRAGSLSWDPPPRQAGPPNPANTPVTVIHPPGNWHCF